MLGGDDAFIAPENFRQFDKILEQSKVWLKPIVFQEGLVSQHDESKTSIYLSSHLSYGYVEVYLFPTRSNGTINKHQLIN